MLSAMTIAAAKIGNWRSGNGRGYTFIFLYMALKKKKTLNYINFERKTEKNTLSWQKKTRNEIIYVVAKIYERHMYIAF